MTEDLVEPGNQREGRDRQNPAEAEWTAGATRQRQVEDAEFLSR